MSVKNSTEQFLDFRNDLNVIEEFLSEKYEFQKNVITSRTEFRFSGEEKPFREVDENIFNSIYFTAKAELNKLSVNDLRRILNSNFVDPYDPFKEYFTKLSVGQNETRDYIEELAATISTTNQDYWRTSLKKWLVAVVASAINPEVVNHQVLILIGEQGVGKTTWLHKLLPESLSGYMYSGFLNPNSKDSSISLAENLLINLDELESLTKGSAGNLKELITKSTIRLRRPYGEYTQNYIRRASMMGSVNSREFIKDETGSRRFLPFTVTSIELDSVIDMDKVYSQAYALYLSGFKYWFSGTDIQEITAENQQYYTSSLEDDILLKYLVPCTSNDPEATFLSATALAQALNNKDSALRVTDSSIKRLGSSLTKNGFIKTTRDNRKVWVIKLNK